MHVSALGPVFLQLFKFEMHRSEITVVLIACQHWIYGIS